MRPALELTRKELANFNVRHALVAMATGGEPGGIAGDYSKLSRNLDLPGSLDAALVIPPQLLARTMATSPGSKGGFATNTAVLSAVAALAPLSIAQRAGATVVPLLDQSTMPRPGLPTAEWLAEYAAGTPVDVTLGQLSTIPRRLQASVLISETLLAQATPAAIDAAIIRPLGVALMSTLDKGVIQGAGGVQPIGITNVGSTGTQSGSTLAAAGLVAMQEQVIVAGALTNPDGLAVIADTASAELLAGRASMASGSVPLWSGPLAHGSVVGMPAYSSTNVPSGTVIVGDFSHIMIFEYSGLEIRAARHDFASATLEIRASMYVDVVVTRAVGFSIATSVT